MPRQAERKVRSALKWLRTAPLMKRDTQETRDQEIELAMRALEHLTDNPKAALPVLNKLCDLHNSTCPPKRHPALGG